MRGIRLGAGIGAYAVSIRVILGLERSLDRFVKKGGIQMDWEKLQHIDIRILYVIILVCLLIPMFKPIGLPIAISDATRQVYETIENLPMVQ